MNRSCKLHAVSFLVAFLFGTPTFLLPEGVAGGKGSVAYPYAFRDVGEEAGVLPHVAGIRGHGVAWGDIDGSGYPSLFVTTFHNEGSKPAMLLRNNKGKFTLDTQEHLRTSGIGSGALFADLANRGRLDLYVSHCAYGKADLGKVPSLLFRNDGGGKFTDISKQSGACPPDYLGRGLAAGDFDGDGLLDLATCEQYYSSQVKTGPCLFRNKGNHTFENIAQAAGLPAGFGGLGVAVGDVNGDGRPDLFLTHGSGGNRLYLNEGKGTFREAPGTRAVFQWPDSKDEPPAGVCIADVNGDGLQDIVVGHHFGRPWLRPAGIRLYLNRGVKEGVPVFEDVSEQAGLAGLPMKPPHLEIQDFDNDGLPDIYVSIVVFKEGKACPVIYKNLGVRDGIPRFREDATRLTDFPTAEDKAVKRTGLFYEKLLKDKKINYMATGPSADFDRDGKMDLFLANWWLEAKSLLLRNETPGGHWLDVRVEGSDGVNRMGVGSMIRVYRAGKLGDTASLLGAREICIGFGYCSGQEAIAHFGLGKEELVDIQVTLPHGKGILARKSVPANQRVTINSAAAK